MARERERRGVELGVVAGKCVGSRDAGLNRHRCAEVDYGHVVKLACSALRRRIVRERDREGEMGGPGGTR